MRFRAGLVFVFLALWLGVGCRKPLAPTVDTNLPPETWITAAPQDTLTSRDENGNLVPPNPGTIPFRYHLYWSGSDQDGAVSGFYWAVTETVGSVGGLPIPLLPGPKPQDYRYTRTRDSVFIFNVLEETNNRQHAFYIYAVDNKGKPDATPARVIFNSLDLYPPIPVIEAQCGVPNPTTGSRATGLIFHPNDAWAGGLAPVPVPKETTMALCDTFSRRTTVSDIIPMGSVVHMQWHSEIRVASNPAVSYKYKIGEGDEVEFVQVPASVTSTEYNTTDRNRLAPGLKIFTLRAIDQAGGARSSPETTRRFYVNWTPDTWFAGPDTIPPGYSNLNNFYATTWYGPPGGSGSKVKERFFSAGQGPNPSPGWNVSLPGSLLSPDSVLVMPARRKANKTFFEIYTEYNFAVPSQPRHRIYVHGEGDTIHMNSWVLLHGGGFDADSPYSLRISGSNENLPGIGVDPVLKSGPANGSPIGFRFRIPVFLDSIGPESTFPESPVYPSSEPSSVPVPRIGGFQGMRQSGRAYAVLRSEDGNRGVDRRIEDPVAFVDSIEKGLIGPGSPRYALKDKVLTFYVNRAPYLLPNFQPTNNQDYLSRQRIPIRLDLSADDDPYQKLQHTIGGMEEGKSALLLRFSVTFRGRRTGSSPPKDTVWAPPELARKTGLNVTGGVLVDIPTFIQGPNVGVDIEVCDCDDCEAVPGQGRCRRYPTINITVPPVTAEAVTQSRANISPIGPGSSGESSRSRTP
jgi:hypothetical protein